jgi:hypothetical protein
VAPPRPRGALGGGGLRVGEMRRGLGVWGLLAREAKPTTVLSGTRSARTTCEARFELPTPSWLRALFCVSRAVPRWTNPGYQSLNMLFNLAEMRFSELPRLPNTLLKLRLVFLMSFQHYCGSS